MSTLFSIRYQIAYRWVISISSFVGNILTKERASDAQAWMDVFLLAWVLAFLVVWALASRKTGPCKSQAGGGIMLTIVIIA